MDALGYACILVGKVLPYSCETSAYLLHSQKIH